MSNQFNDSSSFFELESPKLSLAQREALRIAQKAVCDSTFIDDHEDCAEKNITSESDVIDCQPDMRNYRWWVS